MDAATIRANFEAREHATAELRELWERAAGREMDAAERETEQRLLSEIADYDARIRDGVAALERERTIDEARAKFDALIGETRTVEQPDALTELRMWAGRKGDRTALELLPERRDASPTTLDRGEAKPVIPVTLYAQLTELMFERATVVQAGARTLATVSGENIRLPRIIGHKFDPDNPADKPIGEGKTIAESAPTPDEVMVGAHKFGHITALTYETVVDPAVDLVGWLAADAGPQIGDRLGWYFLHGPRRKPDETGAAPEGLLNAEIPAAQVSPVLVDTAFADDLIRLYHVLPSFVRRNAVWVVHDTTAAAMRMLKDGDGRYLWQSGLVGQVADTFLGRPVLTDPFMPAFSTATSGGKGVLWGDLSGYVVRLAGPLRIDRSDEAGFEDDVVKFRFLQRADGRLVDTTRIAIGTLGHKTPAE
ncbi:hypothetical protein GCM10012275_19300 [Longimycelium tulufanense]|uniref:Phage capsid-like C-terminal domain-containing protein n=1 Tax=Longimycelium tulufanense TaxID=907463 RepID=A0A8J3CCS0_9PSEU|nr:phage major capsid protein [Longimycelium tulufanense]GGM48482.1 hypothetical protein GCM10012275_19300 [Longimycelium tulufanense]